MHLKYFMLLGATCSFQNTVSQIRFAQLSLLLWCVMQVHQCQYVFLASLFLQADKELTVRGEDGRLYHWILPSFFQLLRDLVQEGGEFAILFRTFGTDLPRVLNAVSRALNQGAHPLFPDLPDLKVSQKDTVYFWAGVNNISAFSFNTKGSRFFTCCSLFPHWSFIFLIASSCSIQSCFSLFFKNL